MALHLLQELLQKEISGLEASIASANTAADPLTSQLFSLALNSLQRLHANLLRSDTEEEEAGTNAHLVNMDEDDDDDDDCFFMPMPGAVKWAEPKRFESLAQPIGPEVGRETQFVLVMEPGGWCRIMLWALSSCQEAHPGILNVQGLECCMLHWSAGSSSIHYCLHTCFCNATFVIWLQIGVQGIISGSWRSHC